MVFTWCSHGVHMARQPLVNIFGTYWVLSHIWSSVSCKKSFIRFKAQVVDRLLGDFHVWDPDLDAEWVRTGVGTGK